MNIFERSARNKTRWATSVGNLSVEQLFDLPLTAKRGVSLDAIAQEVNTELQTMTTSFVKTTRPDSRKSELSLQLDVLKHVIESKERDLDRAKTTQETKERKQALMEALENKKIDGINNMSEEELKKELAAIG